MSITVSSFQFETDDVAVIPATAVAVKVTNVTNPYFIRLYETEGHVERITAIDKSLHRAMRNGESTEPTKLQNNDKVVVDNRNRGITSITSSWCRGIIGGLNPLNSTYKIFLPDYGFVVERYPDDLKLLPPNLITEDALSSTIGIYNIVPIALGNIDAPDTKFSISDQWTPTAIQFTREVLTASRETYFDCLARDQSGNKYGELYSVVDDEVIALSKALVLNQFAACLEGELLELIENASSSTKSKSEMVNENVEQWKGKNEEQSEANNKLCNGDSSKNEERSEAENKLCNGNRKKHSVANAERASCKTDHLPKKSNDPTDGLTGNVINTAAYPIVFKGKSNGNQNGISKKGQKVLIRSEVRCPQLLAVADAQFPTIIHKALESIPFTSLMQIQSYVWPAVRKSLNVVAIGPAKCGKTFAYVVPICSFIAAHEDLYSMMPNENGPLALILCSSSSDVSQVSSICMKLLEKCPTVRVVAGHNGISEEKVVVELCNGCQILVSTPRYLARVMNHTLMSKNKALFSFKRVCHLVLDGAEVIVEKYYEALTELMGKHEVMRNRERRIPGAPSLQWIFVAQTLTLQLKDFISKTMTKPYIYIGSYLEAAVFAALQLSIKYSWPDKKSKPEIALDLLGNQQPMYKTMIVCTSTEEVEELNEHLRSLSTSTLVAYGQMNLFEIQGVKESWAASVSGKHAVLICTDEFLVDLDITDVEFLIHYSLPSKSKSQFYFRFSTLMDNYPQGVMRKKEETNCKVVVLLDENNKLQFQGVVSMLERLGNTIPSDMSQAAKVLELRMDKEEKSGHPLCGNLKALGSCRNKYSCPERHSILAGVDDPMTRIEIGDHVKLIISFVHSATHFSARVVEYRKSSSKKKIPFDPVEFTGLLPMMHRYYSNKENRKLMRRPKIGDVCAFGDLLDGFKRVRILSILEKDNEGFAKVVSVWGIDNGNLLKATVSQLLEIPEELAKWPSHVVEVYLANVAPQDDEATWTSYADDAVHSWFKTHLSASAFVLAKVQLHLGYTLWVDPLEIRTKPIGYAEVVISSLKSELIKGKNGMENNQHLGQLLTLCQNSGLTTINGHGITSIGDS